MVLTFRKKHHLLQQLSTIRIVSKAQAQLNLTKQAQGKQEAEEENDGGDHEYDNNNSDNDIDDNGANDDNDDDYGQAY